MEEEEVKEEEEKEGGKALVLSEIPVHVAFGKA